MALKVKRRTFGGDELKIKTPSKNCRFYSEDGESLKQRIGGGIGRLENLQYYNGSKFEDRSYYEVRYLMLFTEKVRQRLTFMKNSAQYFYCI